VLKTSPYNLAWGTLVYVRVVATNIYGNSGISDVGFGANLVTNPDPPINLAEDLTQRTLTTLGLTWSDAPFNGGDYILDY